jgi:hypothetical protein
VKVCHGNVMNHHLLTGTALAAENHCCRGFRNCKIKKSGWRESH